jgi:hypothetical protein
MPLKTVVVISPYSRILSGISTRFPMLTRRLAGGFAVFLRSRLLPGLKISRTLILAFSRPRKPGIPVPGAAIRLSPYGTGLAATLQATRGACACLALTCSLAISGDARCWIAFQRAGHATRRSRLLPAGVRPLAGAPDPQGGPGKAHSSTHRQIRRCSMLAPFSTAPPAVPAPVENVG